MNLFFFYRDYLHSGGVPDEMRNLIESVPEKIHVTVFCKKNTGIKNKNKNVIYYSNIIFFLFKFPYYFFKLKPDYMLGVGFFILDVFWIALISKIFCVKFLLWPIGQLTEVSMRGKVFYENPDVKKLYSNDIKSIKSNFLNLNSKNHFSIIIKKLYTLSVGKIINRISEKVIFFSDFELENYKKFFPKKDVEAIFLKWGMYEESNTVLNSNYYKKSNKLNYIYWGRLDWHYKGIDRLLKGVLRAKKMNATLPFILHLCGPDYNNGREKIVDFVKYNKLEDCINIIEKSDYVNGSKDPLSDADLSILLSRWDGFPRALRESISYNVPIMVSKETHFYNLVNDYSCGFPIENADDEESVANALLKYKKIVSLKENCKMLSNNLEWDSLLNQFYIDLRV